MHKEKARTISKLAHRFPTCYFHQAHTQHRINQFWHLLITGPFFSVDPSASQLDYFTCLQQNYICETALPGTQQGIGCGRLDDKYHNDLKHDMPVVYNGVPGTGEGDLFQGLKLWIGQRVPQRARWIDLVQVREESRRETPWLLAVESLLGDFVN